MTDTCKKCMYVTTNEETFPFCIKCAYCCNRQHVLQIHLDGTLPKFCQVCHYHEWKKEFDTKNTQLIQNQQPVFQK